jgi:serine/threonine protein kinase
MGLDYLHTLPGTPFFHRDLKPENILFSQGRECCKIADLGHAKHIHAEPPFTE